jgi:hypothetical protein
MFWKVVGLARGPLSLVSTLEEQEKLADPIYNIEVTDVVDPPRWLRDTPLSLYPQKLPLSLPTSGGRSVRIVHSRTQATELVCFFLFYCYISI